MSSDLVAFLRARWDLEEAHARKDLHCYEHATAGDWKAHYGVNLPYSEIKVDGDVVVRLLGGRHDHDALLVARMVRSGRERAEHRIVDIDSKREILDAHPTVPADWAVEIAGDCRTCSEPAPCETIRLLAAPYQGHPDWRTEWNA